jgi:hypothetical protein
LQEIQEYFRASETKILKFSSTRCVSRHKCVTRLLEQWEVLTHYFTIALHEDGLKSAELILNELQNIYTKGYFLFRKYILQIFNSFNGLFQSRQTLIHVLYSESSKLSLLLCKNYMQAHVVLEQDLSKINISHPSYFRAREELNVGPESYDLFKKMPREGREIHIF